MSSEEIGPRQIQVEALSDLQPEAISRRPDNIRSCLLRLQAQARAGSGRRLARMPWIASA